MKCMYCQKEFTAKRTTARFCSDVCRVYWNRTKAPILVAPIAAKKLRQAPEQVTVVDEGSFIKTFEFCKHDQVKGFCKKGCK